MPPAAGRLSKKLKRWIELAFSFACLAYVVILCKNFVASVLDFWNGVNPAAAVGLVMFLVIAVIQTRPDRRHRIARSDESAA